MKKIKSLILSLLILTPLSANALDCSAADKYAKSVSDDVMKILQTEKTDSAKTHKLEEMFSKVVDSQWMGKFVLGVHYREIKPAEQAAYTNAYHDYLVSSYVPSFKKYNGEKVVITGSKPAGTDELVMTKIERNTGAPILINYRVVKKDGCYKVRDIIAEGVSLINTQRQDFDSVVSGKGFDELLNLLKSKNNQ